MSDCCQNLWGVETSWGAKKKYDKVEGVLIAKQMKGFIIEKRGKGKGNTKSTLIMKRKGGQRVSHKEKERKGDNWSSKRDGDLLNRGGRDIL